ncbi:MAG: AmmeMemoRadiSam system radical SAM enzyme [Elusimicrobia bacterium]|nr:AmmeMemoRadiSam system radical SAM enzyme [Elusimicrobiota bacterium]
MRKNSFFLLLILFFSVLYAQEEFPKYSDVKVQLKEAQFWERLPNDYVKCGLCPWRCTIAPGQRGICRSRENINGRFFTLNYARPCSINVDPIEKKPFFHFLPGEQAFSLATAGCNVGCKFCQNWQISKITPEESSALYILPEDIVKLAKRSKAKVIAYTYSEPTIFYEYMIEIASAARKEGLKNVVVSCGYINQEPLKKLLKYIDAYKIDLKSFNKEYYENIVGAKLEPVLETIKTIKESGTHLEIVYLVVPSLNDKPDEIREMCKWLIKNVGPDVPLHFTRFHPDYKMMNYPSTPVATVNKLRKIAMEEGLNYVFVGNVPFSQEGENTYCSKCKKLLIQRRGFWVTQNNIKEGKCKFCGHKIYGVWGKENANLRK